MLNMNFDERLAINTQMQEWQASPFTVWRKPLEREAKESGYNQRCKVRAGASFKQHSHPYGEEILVLEGVFSDEHGDYPAGTYLRNPPGRRTARSVKKAVLF